jgi:hypothetical protein
MPTQRERWDLGVVKVVVDTVDFGHVVGEVEICCEVEEGKRGEVVGKLEGRIEGCMDFWRSLAGRFRGRGRGVVGCCEKVVCLVWGVVLTITPSVWTCSSQSFGLRWD